MLTFLVFLIWFQTGSRIDAAKLPKTAAAVGEFIPRGWVIESQIEGDLNRDSIPDLAVTLVEQMPANADKDNPPERQRALLILFKTADGKFNRAALADKVLACTRCGGAFYDISESPADVKIINGVLIVRQDYGSRELTEEIFRFRYEPETKRFALIGMDLNRRDRLTAVEVRESSNLLTGLKLTTKTKLNEQTGKEMTVSKTSQRVKPDKQFIEDVAASYGK